MRCLVCPPFLLSVSKGDLKVPTKIRISGEIGWDVTARSILEEIDAARGDDLEIEIASVGGSVFQGTEIANGIRSYKRSHPSAQILITITGLAASMASYIASVDVADLVVAYDNAVGMYHNPSTIAIGDYRDMQQKAAFLQGLTTLMRKAYATRSGKSTDDIAKMMDDTTWLFGDQLREEGFVDEIIPAPDSEEGDDPESAVASAQLRFTEMISEQRSRGLKEDETRVAAVFQEVIRTTGQSQDAERIQRPPVAISHGANRRDTATPTMDSKAVVGGSKTTPAVAVGKGEKRMNLEELRATHPETYAQAEANGVKREQERVAALMAMKAEKPYQGISAVQEVIDESIAKGRSKDETLGLVLATFSKSTSQAEAESPGDIVTGQADTATGELQKETGEPDPVTEV